MLLIVSVTVNLLFLATFKYLGFFVTELAELLDGARLSGPRRACSRSCCRSASPSTRSRR